MRIIVSGIGTNVGKTVVSTILCLKYNLSYWKPVQSGMPDTEWVKQYVPHLFPAQYQFKKPLSPHQAAEEENMSIRDFLIPDSDNLVIEMAGGILTPLRSDLLSVDAFSQIPAHWVLVSRNYLGSINHTLLTLEVLKARGILVKMVIFNGVPDSSKEEIVKKQAPEAVFERITPQKIHIESLKNWAASWQEI